MNNDAGDATQLTEATLLGALRDRYYFRGNGGAGRYAFLTHVRAGAAFDQQEIDAIVMNLWPSDRLDVNAFEVKCSRPDWLREIRPDTSKSAVTRDLCDTFTILAPRGAVRDGELPEDWGLLEATMGPDGVKLRKATSAQRLHLDEPTRFYMGNRTLPRGFVVAMLRAAGAVPGMTSGRKREAVSA